MDLPDTVVRLELDPVRPFDDVLPWWPTRQLRGLRSDVQFVDASSAQTDVNFGVHRLSEFSIDRPILFWATQWAGAPEAQGGNGDEWAIRGAPYFSRRPRGQVPDWECRPPLPANCDAIDHPVRRARFGQVGTVFGLAMEQQTGDLYAGAYYKRLSGLKDRRPGAIYRITEGGDVSLFARLFAGRDRHPTSDDIDDWVNGCAGATVQEPRQCDTSWNYVGNTGLGSVVIDPEDENLYTVNLRFRTCRPQDAEQGGVRDHR